MKFDIWINTLYKCRVEGDKNMVVDLNMDLVTRLSDMYKTMAEPKAPSERKEVSPDEFWSSMRMVATNNQALIKYQTK